MMCSVDGCDRPRLARGLCNRHYLRWKTYGSPLGGGPEVKRAPAGAPERWLRDHLLHDGAGCLIYPFARTPNGYAKFGDGGAHRWVCEQTHGPAPSLDSHAAHSCGNGQSGCVHPKHIRWASPVENALDRDAHGKTMRGEAHYGAKIDKDTAVAIYSAKFSGATVEQTATKFGISRGATASIWSGQNWAWATGANGGVGKRRASA